MLCLSLIKNILLLGYLLVYAYSLRIVEVPIYSLPENYSDVKTSSISFNIKISNSLNFDFLTIKVLNQLNQDKKNLGQTVFLSYSDSDCQKERNQMSFSPYQDSIMILNMTEIKAKNKCFICVQCLDDNNCKYIFGYDQNYIQRFPMADIAYSYYASKNYTNMFFGIRAEDRIFDKFKNAQKYYEIFWIKRLYNNEFINYQDKSIIHEDYNAIYFLKNISKANRYIDFNVSSKEGEFIQVGSSLLSYQYSIDSDFYCDIKPLNINDIESIGHLQKPNLNEVCYNLKLNDYYKSTGFFYIYGLVQEKFIKTYFKYWYGEIVPNTEKEIIDGNILEIVDQSRFSYLFCVSILETNRYNIPKDITYTLQLISHKIIKPYYFFIPPQKPETIYPRIIQNGEYIILSRVKPPEKSPKMSFTINSIYGNPEIRFHQCTQFPFCNYEDDHIKMLSIIKSNKMDNYDNIWMIESIFGAYQSLIFLTCPNVTEYCIFYTTFFSENDQIILKEGKIFSQLLLDNHKNKFIAEFGEHKNLLKIILELIIFGGDAKLNISNENLKITNYFLLNKKIYIINANELNEKKIEFEIDSNKKSFYSIRYTVIRSDELNKMNLMDTIGINYIDYIGNDYKYKNIEVQNSKYDKRFPLLINYYSPNCKFQIKKNNSNLNTSLYNNFYQEYIPSTSSINYHYNISIKEYEQINSNDKKCKLFSNSFKITNETSEIIGTLLINENIPLVYEFKDIYKIRYIYPNYDSEKDTIINLKLLNNKKYLINITYNYNNMILVKNITKSEIISIKKNIITKLEEESNLIIEISLLDFSTDTISILKTVVHQIKNKFMYVGKGMYKKDLLSSNNNLYLYTDDIYKNDEGYIKLDLLKENVKVKVKIVEMEKIDISEEINWDSIKTEDDNDLKFDFYTKKIYFTEHETSICKNGCYLLINLEPPDNKDFSREIKFFPFDIIVVLTKKSISNSFKIKFEPDEIIVGTFFNNYYEDVKMFELYQLYIPYNAESIDIECHSKYAKLLIFLEDEQISYEKSSFIVEPGKLLNIPKQSILSLNSNYNSLDNITIIICVYTEKIYWVDISYSFKVHLNKKDNFKIKNINSDSKTLCHPENYENNKYRCLFMIDSSQFSPNNYIILYPKTKSINEKIYMKGDYLTNNTIYDILDIESLNNCIPNRNANFDTENNDINYILLTPNEENKYFYLNVLSNSPSEFELISNFYNYNDDLIPNPNLMQIYALKNSVKNEIKLNFISINSIMINAVLIKGEGEIHFNNKVFNLNEKNNKILFALTSDVKESLIFKNKNIEKDILLSSDKEDDFLFYIEYYFRNSTLNIDEITLGDNSLLEYEQSDFPLYLYSNIDKHFTHDFNIFFNVYNLTYNKEDIKYIKNRELDILSLFFEEKNKDKIFNKTEKGELFNIKGTYDPAINVGQIYISKDYANNIISSNYKDLTYLLAIEKNEENDNIYNGINMKTVFIKENSGIPIEENKYIFGKIYENNTNNTYKLKINDNAEYIMIQFSANSEILNFTIKTNEDNEGKIDIFENYTSKKEKGKIITTFKRPNNIEYLYLNIYANNSKNISEKYFEKLKNYVFKYKNIFDAKNLNEYPILKNNNKLKCSITERKGERLNIQLSYNKIENEQNYEIIYSLKMVSKKDYIEGESFDTIAITESNSIVSQFIRNKVNITNNSMDIPIEFFDDNFAYIQLIAQIIDGDNIEYFSYQPIKSIKEIIFKYDGKNKKNIWPIILIIAIILISVTAIILILKCKKKNIKSDEQILKQVEMANPIEYDDVLLDKSIEIN